MDQSARILVIDDERGIREGCKRALAPLGYEVEAADTIKQGLQKIQQEPFDLVLLDIMLPDGSGIDLLEPIAELDPDIVSIVITGYATVELAVEAIKQGAYDFISKPFESDVLLMTVNQGLEKRRLSLEAKRLQSIEEEAQKLARDKEQMERLNQFKTAFTLTVAHELRAPVAALLSFLRTLQKGYVPAEQREDILRRSIERAEELLDLVNDLLNLADVDRERISAERSLISLLECLEEVLPLFRTQAEERGIELTMAVNSNPQVEADPEQMKQVWSNLISNAIKYTPEGGKVRVSLAIEDGWAVAWVKDTGIGIAPEQHEKIFEDFYRTPQAKAFQRLGTGLGLTLVKRILESHRGKVSVESTLGEGSTFQFRLPLAREGTSIEDPAEA